MLNGDGYPTFQFAATAMRGANWSNVSTCTTPSGSSTVPRAWPQSTTLSYIEDRAARVRPRAGGCLCADDAPVEPQVAVMTDERGPIPVAADGPPLT